MHVIRYVNGRRIDADLKKYMIGSDLILKTIKTVNERLKNGSHQGILEEKGS